MVETKDDTFRRIARNCNIEGIYGLRMSMQTLIADVARSAVILVHKELAENDTFIKRVEAIDQKINAHAIGVENVHKEVARLRKSIDALNKILEHPGVEDKLAALVKLFGVDNE